ncbi:MAG: hypothetical protein GY801_28960 [bacterium]|nr:hypothetical protein [bacterium]
MKFTEERLTKILAEAEKEKQITALIQGLDKNEIRLITRCQSQDKSESIAAFNQIIARYQDGVFAYISQRVQQQKQASRLARNIFVKAYTLLSKSAFHGEMSLDEWLFSLSKQHVDARKKSFPSKDTEKEDFQVIPPADITSKGKKLAGESECSQRMMNQLLSHFDKIHAPRDLREQINAIIDPKPFFALPSHQFAAIATSFVIIFALAFLVMLQYRNIDETMKSSEQRLEEIAKVMQTLEQQGIHREQLQSQTIVIGTGSLAAGTFSMEDIDLISTHVTEPEKALFITISGGIEHLKTEIRNKILAVHGEIKTQEVEFFPEENFKMLTLEAEIPENLDMPFSLLLLLDEPVQAKTPPAEKRLNITLVVFEKES